jgi:hypothetical protein
MTIARRAKHSEPASDQTIAKAMPRKEFVALLTRIMSSKKVVSDEQRSVRELKGDAADLHRGALGWMVRLKSMTPAKRNEQLFHFHAYCDHLGWPEKGLDLGDREPAGQVVNIEPLPDAMRNDDDRDVRPRFLRLGGSDAAPPDELPKAN